MRSGRDIVDHAPNAADDLANAAAGTLTLLHRGERPRLQLGNADLSEPASLSKLDVFYGWSD